MTRLISTAAVIPAAGAVLAACVTAPTPVAPAKTGSKLPVRV
jgi:hypothetical protein